MRKEIGVMLVETNDGQVGVQLFADKVGVDAAFENLKGKIGDPQSRATLLWVKYNEGDSPLIVSTSKMLPVVESIDSIPDGFALGKGPVKFDKEESNGSV